MIKVLKRSAWVLVVAAMLLGVPRFAGFVADQVPYSHIDPDGAYAWISIHHLVQALIFLTLMFAIRRIHGTDFGFGWGDRRTGLRFVGIFALIFAGYTVVSMIIVLVAGSFRTFLYPLTATNVVGQLAFQLLLSGPSEELIFRSFAISMLALALPGSLMKGKVSCANICAAIIFGLAHVGIAFAPFALTYDPFQVVYAAALGIVYGICFERSKSVYYPMMLHSISNVVAVSVSVVATAIIG
jgi:membrane protease YdiL (CAAX protease family)